MTKMCICGHKKTDHARWVNDNQCLICNHNHQRECWFPTYDLEWIKFQSKTPMRNQSYSEKNRNE